MTTQAYGTDGIFLEGAASVINLPHDDTLDAAIMQFGTSLTSFTWSNSTSSAANVVNNIANTAVLASSAISAFFLLIGAFVGFIPYVLGYMGAPDMLVNIVQGLFILITGIAAMQLITSKWLPFAE